MKHGRWVPSALQNLTWWGGATMLLRNARKRCQNTQNMHCWCTKCQSMLSPAARKSDVRWSFGWEETTRSSLRHESKQGIELDGWMHGWMDCYSPLIVHSFSWLWSTLLNIQNALYQQNHNITTRGTSCSSCISLCCNVLSVDPFRWSNMVWVELQFSAAWKPGCFLYIHSDDGVGWTSYLLVIVHVVMCVE